MCFGNSQTIDDPTQPPVRATNPWSRKIHDPTQQPIHITESNEAHMSEVQGSATTEHKGSHKDRPAFVDVTDKEFSPVTRKLSSVEAEAARLMPKKSVEKKYRSKNSGASTYAYGAAMGADFAAGAM
ncbi:uncharacterized protein Z519_07300 [Cladophialophora bantiana CBS 173.52]|uniref:Uncharacterized protein n=1 Tax=Cladophialophora bantiana (strain ATCC 10958 / CBS 173.52 / CDC B-1940 / NIH 8579) TaxID=1442370 RepID=A0A0D2EQW9_CLAB1|nr:uncharacterized protein Z519_07300 [Cladophialophora bantiana CBS 173.52]KIW92316.1 hypothetical protein Z519_07300 [Cladophialophora bantiana CBS 173.52]